MLPVFSCFMLDRSAAIRSSHKNGSAMFTEQACVSTGGSCGFMKILSLEKISDFSFLAGNSASSLTDLKERLHDPVVSDFRVKQYPEEGTLRIPNCLDADL